MFALEKSVGRSFESGAPWIRAALTVMDPWGKVGDLHGAFQWRARVLLLALAAEGYGLIRVLSGRRTMEQQWVLYGQGRTAEQCIAGGVLPTYAAPAEREVTWTRPATSMHVRGRAMDLDLGAYKGLCYQAVEIWCGRLGLEWGGKWKARDMGHVELRS